MTLCKSLTCGIWNNSSFVSKQFDRVGPAYSSSLVNAGYCSLRSIAEADPRTLELVLNKQPPFGNHVRNSAAAMPEYDLNVERVEGLGGERMARQRSGANLKIKVRRAKISAEKVALVSTVQRT